MPEEDRPVAPILDDWLLWIWRAWHRLTHDRPWVGGGMGSAAPGRIPWTVVMDWSDRRGYDPDEAEFLERCIGAMDQVYIDWHTEQAKASGK